MKYFAKLMTYYEIYGFGKTREEAINNCIKGYKKFYPKTEWSVKNATYKELNDYFGINVYEIKDGWASE